MLNPRAARPLALRALALATLTFAATACSSDSDAGTSQSADSQPESVEAESVEAESSGDSAETPASTASPATTAEETRTIETIWGPVDIPANPINIVAVDEYAATNLLVLGVEPTLVVGTYQATSQAAILDSYGVEMIPGSYGVYNFEAIAAQQPDLLVLVGNEETEELFGQLSEIAPTVVIPFIAPWREIVEFSGVLLDRPDAAESLISKVEAQIENVATAVGDEGTTISLLANSPGFGTYTIGQGTSISDLVNEAGFDRPEAQLVPAQVGVSVVLSNELIGEHDGDILITFGGGDPMFTPQELAKLDLFTSLNAVADGQVLEAVGNIWTGTGPFAVYWALQDLDTISQDGPDAVLGTTADLEARWAAFSELANN